MRQHRNSVRPLIIMLVVLSTGVAIVISSDWLSADDTSAGEDVLNQDQSLSDDAASEPEAFAPITSDDAAITTIFSGSGFDMAWETAIGPANATVTIIEFGTYGCQICRQVHQIGLIDQLLGDYPNDITFVYVSWPIFHPNDELATEAVFCAQQQGKASFWAYHNALYDMSFADYNTFNQPSDYITLAEEINLDAASVGTCLAEGKFREYVYELAEQGNDLNLPGTPTFFVNGTPTRAFELESRVLAILDAKHTSDIQAEH